MLFELLLLRKSHYCSSSISLYSVTRYDFSSKEGAVTRVSLAIVLVMA